jgi:DNA-binding NarL/FixJ family response regulator
MDKPHNPIRIVIVDDHSIVRQGLTSLLREYSDFEVVGEADNGTDALQMVETLLPDVLITDISMPGLSGYELLEHIKAKAMATKVLFLTMHDRNDFIVKAIDLGAAGYLTKDTLKDELVQAVRKVYDNQVYYGQRIMHTIISELATRKNAPHKESDLEVLLSKREYQILSLITEGLSSRQIAEKLFISERTVSDHRLNMMGKCNVNNTIELVKLYLRYKNTSF